MSLSLSNVKRESATFSLLLHDIYSTDGRLNWQALKENYLILLSIDDACKSDIGWPAEIILAKLIKWPEINIFVKLTQMLKTCTFTSFHNRGERSTYQRTQIKSLCLTRRIKTSLNNLYTTIILSYTDYQTDNTCCHDKETFNKIDTL